VCVLSVCFFSLVFYYSFLYFSALVANKGVKKFARWRNCRNRERKKSYCK